jgi:hypothetical protein
MRDRSSNVDQATPSSKIRVSEFVTIVDIEKSSAEPKVLYRKTPSP